MSEITDEETGTVVLFLSDGSNKNLFSIEIITFKFEFSICVH